MWLPVWGCNKTTHISHVTLSPNGMHLSVYNVIYKVTGVGVIFNFMYTEKVLTCLTV